MQKSLSVFFTILSLGGCASLIQTPDDIKVGRKEASDHCKELGKVTGSTLSVHGTREEALNDMKQMAADKGANYVQLKQFSANGNAVTGIAYICQ